MRYNWKIILKDERFRKKKKILKDPRKVNLKIRRFKDLSRV